MSWKTSKFASSLISLFVDPTPDAMEDNRLEDVREAMLASLHGLRQCERVDTLTRRLRWAPHAQSLWYLRMDVMTLLADQRSEAEAREVLRDLTRRFHGLVPTTHMARPSRLNSL